jgi:dolichol-phosphate mannosyltransferase
MRVFVFFPVCNEGEAAASLIERVIAECDRLDLHYRVVVVDDGSTDGGLDSWQTVARGRDVTVLRHDQNRGLQAALTTGLLWIDREARPDDVVIMMDGDDTHDPTHFSPMLAAIASGSDIVIASRYRKGARVIGVGRFRRLLSRGSSSWGRLFFRLPGVRDFACGFRAFRASLLRAARERWGARLFELEGFGFICSVELLVRLSAFATRISEVPLVLHYERKKGPSKMSALRTARGYWALWRIAKRWR